MKKVFLKSMLLLCALIVGSSNAWADSETITLSEQGYSNEQKVTSTTSGDVTLTYNKGTSSTDPAYYNTGSGVRVYSGGNMAITASGYTITAVSITYAKNNSPTISFSVNDGGSTTSSSVSSSPSTWAGSATTVYFNVATKGHVRIQAVTVTYTAITKHTLSMEVSPSATGSVTPSSDTEVGETKTQAISATPNAGYHFVNWTVSGEGSSVADASAASTTFTMGTEDATVTANFAQNPQYTLSSSVYPSSAAGTVTLGSTLVTEGLSTTISAEAKAGYEFSEWEVSGTGATLGNKDNASTTLTMGSADATVTAKFTAVTTYRIDWSVNGVIVKTENVKEGNALTFVAPTSGIPGGYEYKGWSASAILTPQASETGITYVTEATSTENITYYCVLAQKVGSPLVFSSYTAVSTAQDDWSGTYILGATYTGGTDETKKGTWMYSAPSSSKKYGEIVAIGTLTSEMTDNEIVITKSTNGYTIYHTNSSQYFAYNGSNNELNFAEDVSDKKQEWTITGATGVIKNAQSTSRVLKYNGSSPRFACYTTGQTETTLYKKTYTGGYSYTNYCTTAPAYTLIPTPDLYYTTFYDASSNVSLPDGVTAYWGEYDEGELTLKAFSGANADVVPAGHAVILKASSAASFTVTTTAATAFDMTGIENDLIGSTGTSANANTYVLAYQGSPAATGFFKMTSGIIPAHKAYLDLTSGGGAPSAIRVVEENNNATSIEAIEEAEKAVKFLENGQIYILREGVVYDALGRIVK